jgi:hypothetical protein
MFKKCGRIKIYALATMMVAERTTWSQCPRIINHEGVGSNVDAKVLPVVLFPQVELWAMRPTTIV